MRLKCACGRHAFRVADERFVVFTSGGPEVVDEDSIPKACRESLDPSIVGWTTNGDPVRGIGGRPVQVKR
jgi:hypothetical protein